MKRKNGFTCPPSIHQLFTWTCIPIQVLLNELSIIPVMPEKLQIIYAIFYHLTLTIFLYFGLITTIQDPTDPLSQLGIHIKSNKKSFFCNICKSSVMLRSKHCSICDKCVSGFDHHCKWINNCIGSKNYKNFVFFILNVFLNSLLILAFSVFYISVYYSDNDSSILQLNSNLEKAQGSSLWLAEILIVLVYSIISVFFTSYLLILHLFLKLKGMTTFEYIISKRIKTLPSISEDFSLKNSSISTIITQGPKKPETTK